MPHYVNVVIDNKSQETDCFYTYLADDEVGKGSKVMVSFGNRHKLTEGYVVEADVVPDCDESKIKSIDSYDPERSLNSEMIDTALWMRQRYGIKYFDGIKMFTVGGKRDLKDAKSRGSDEHAEIPELSEDQKKAVGRILPAIEKGQQKSFLIKGVTNSGKTEVYMRAIDKALSLGRTAIVLLPEIALSGQTEKRLRERFGDELVATLHSKLTTSRKLHEWKRIRSGKARIVVGARTAVFSPLENIGVIVIDEEHESTYKSDHNPKYETVDIAYKRAGLSNAVLILGSATPSVVSYYRAKKGIYELIEMPNRIGESCMPDIELVDMKQEMRNGNLGVISTTLAREIEACLQRKEQIILFLNRRGFSTQILCPDCGHKMVCDDCGITLTYHKKENSAVCHYCGKKYPLVETCPKCNSKYIKYLGSGTEKVEEAVISLFKDARVERFDLDTAGSENEIKSVLEAFQKRETDILVGTQLLAKGLDFRNVGLVGIINADVSLNIPDYRSSERTYQLITQVAGRAGRSKGSSKVIIQTYEPDSDVIKFAGSGDYEAFYESELLHRNIMNYPPFTDIIQVSFASKKEDSAPAMDYAVKYRKKLLSMTNLPKGVSILPPREEQLRVDGHSRVSFIIKAPQGSRAGFMNSYMQVRSQMIKANASCYIEIDVNPYGIF